MTYGWHDLVGNAGVVSIVTAYLLMQVGRLDGRSLVFSSFNAVGAALIIVSLVVEFNMSAMLMEVAWLLISLIGIVRGLAGASRGGSR